MFEIKFNSPVPIYEQITDQIKMFIDSGKLEPGDSLPPIRQLASQLGVAINTIARAYQELEREDIIISNGRKGSFIKEIKKDIDNHNTRVLKRTILKLHRKGMSQNEIEELFKSHINQIFK